jgi:hypothetical protein
MRTCQQSTARQRRGRFTAFLAACTLLVCLIACTPAAAAEQGKALGYTGWDNSYFYFAARVDDHCVWGTNVGAFSEPWEDDSIDLCFDMSGSGAQAPDEGCARMAVSAAGGFTALLGSSQGTWRPARSWLQGLRFDPVVQGTLNKPRDDDTGYIIEIAIPWQHLGGAPRPGTVIGFAFAVHMRGEQDGFASSCPALESESSLDVPASWCRMVFSPKATPEVAQGGQIVCPRLLRPPAVDGTLQAIEWMGATVIPVSLPEVAVPAPAARARRACHVMALYTFPDSSPATWPEQPLEGIGPWWNVDQVAWHKRQIRQARQAAIDTLAVSWHPGGGHEARRALASLVQALLDAKQEGRTYPLLALYLPAGSLGAVLPSGDLRTAEAKDALYRAIREFFLTVPPEFRAQLITDRGRANLILMGDPQGIADWDGSQGGFVQHCTKAFEKDFGSALMWLGDSQWGEKGAVFDAWWAGRKSSSAAAPSARTARVVKRGPTAGNYDADLAQAMRTNPDFIIIDSWNDFPAATAICPSRQHGWACVDITRRSIVQLMARGPSATEVRWDSLPRVISPGVKWQIEMLLANYTLADLSTAGDASFEYTLQNEKDPAARGRGDAARSLSLPAGGAVPVLVEVTGKGKSGPLPDGRYRLTLRLARSAIPILVNRIWQKTVAQITLPVSIGAVPQWAAALVSGNLPVRLQAGGHYQVQVRLRNDGAAPWRKGKVKLGYRWDSPDEQPSPEQPSGAQGLADLPKDVGTGQIVTVPIAIEAPASPGPHVITLELRQGDQVMCQVGQQEVQAVPAEPSVRLVRAEVPRAMQAGEQYKANLVLGNVGPGAWGKGQVSVSALWHYLDGTEAGLESAANVMSEATPVGSVGLVQVPLPAPRQGGSYRLAFRIAFTGDKNEPPGTEQYLEPVAVQVTGGPFEPVDLSQFANVVAATTAQRRSGGDFDGAGRSLPAEYVPPDAAAEPGGWYPCGYYGSKEAPRNIPFLFPRRKEGRGYAVACNGQAISLPAGSSRVHLLAAAVGEDVTAEFVLVTASGERRAVSVAIADWLQGPRSPQDEGLAVPMVRTATADEPRPAFLHHYVLDAHQAVTLELPKDTRARIVALTAERSPQAQ